MHEVKRLLISFYMALCVPIHLRQRTSHVYQDHQSIPSAILYSLVETETAKANMINTFEYFNLLLTEIPQHMDDKDLRFIDNLLPWSPRVQKECPSRYKKS